MGLFSESLNNFDDLFTHELRDVYDAENQILDALPLMADAAAAPELKQAFTTHLQETQVHAQRLEDVFRRLGQDAKRVTCPAMKGLIKEGNEAISASGDARVKDAALIAAAQRVEHYEIAAYGTARTLASEAGREHAADLFDQTLDEEKEADKLLNKIATGGLLKTGVNEQAAR
jgi:ferritin-like metal-binding protein YciE